MDKKNNLVNQKLNSKNNTTNYKNNTTNNKNDITNISDESADYINSIVKDSKFGFFKPVSLNENTIIYNFHGGAEWIRASIDHTSQTMYVNSNNIPWNAKLIQKVMNCT